MPAPDRLDRAQVHFLTTLRENGTAKSLATVIDSEKYADIKYGIKFIKGNVGYNGKFYTFPYFCSFLLKRHLAEYILEQSNGMTEG